MAAPSIELVRQLPLPPPLFVRNPHEFVGTRRWEARGYGCKSETFPLYLKQEGTKAPVVLRALLRTYPQVTHVTVATMHIGAEYPPTRYKDIVARHATTGRLERKAGRVGRVEGWNSDVTALGLLSLVKVRGRQTAHIPMMRFFGNVPDEIGSRIFPEYPGFIMNDGVEQNEPVHVFWGATVMPWDRWLRFLNRCSLMPDVDQGFIRRSLRDGTSITRLFASPRRPHAPEVVDMKLPGM